MPASAATQTGMESPEVLLLAMAILVTPELCALAAGLPEAGAAGFPLAAAGPAEAALALVGALGGVDGAAAGVEPQATRPNSTTRRDTERMLGIKLYTSREFPLRISARFSSAE